MATRGGSSSESVMVMSVGLGKFVSCLVDEPPPLLYHGHNTSPTVPGQPSITIVRTFTATSISLSWSVPSGSVVTSYEVMWQRDTSGECSDEDEDSATITVIY